MRGRGVPRGKFSMEMKDFGDNFQGKISREGREGERKFSWHDLKKVRN